MFALCHVELVVCLAEDRAQFRFAQNGNPRKPHSGFKNHILNPVPGFGAKSKLIFSKSLVRFVHLGAFDGPSVQEESLFFYILPRHNFIASQTAPAGTNQALFQHR